MIIVIAGIIQNDNQILIARRGAHKSLAGFWEFPGGKLEGSETEEACLKRELQEELNIKVQVDRLFMISKHNYGEFQIELRSYFCTYRRGTIKLIDHDQYNWADRNSLANYNWAPADIPIVNALISNI